MSKEKPKIEIPKGVPKTRPDEPKPKGTNNMPKYEHPPSPPPPKK